MAMWENIYCSLIIYDFGFYVNCTESLDWKEVLRIQIVPT